VCVCLHVCPDNIFELDNILGTLVHIFTISMKALAKFHNRMSKNVAQVVGATSSKGFLV